MLRNSSEGGKVLLGGREGLKYCENSVTQLLNDPKVVFYHFSF